VRIAKLTGLAAVAAATVASGMLGFSGAANADVRAAAVYNPISIAYSNKCLDVYDGGRADKTAIVQYTCDATKTHQQFTLDPVVDPDTNTTYYRIKAAHSGKCIDIWDSSQDDTADAIQYTCRTDKYNQQFKAVPAGLGRYNLVARHSGKCLDLEKQSKDDKVNVHQYRCNFTLSQAWWVPGLSS
jgi:hypothetical protein